MMFGIQIFVSRSPQTSRNTRHHKLDVLLSPQARLVSIQLQFICVLSVFAVSFQLLLSSLGSSTSSPPQITLTLSPIFSSVSVASPVSVSSVLILFSTVPVIHPGIDLPVVSCMWVHLVCSHHDRWKLSKNQKIIQFLSTQTELDVSRLPVKDISFCRYKLSWKLSAGLVTNTWICHNRHSWKRPNFLPEIYIFTSPTSWLEEMCWFPVRNISFCCYQWS